MTNLNEAAAKINAIHGLAEWDADTMPLAPAPTNFFMTIRDIAFWVRSARADARLGQWRHERGIASAFDHLYADIRDPFGAELPQYRYQQRKYDSLLSMLPARRFRNVLDVGCGLGSFTRKLAPFCNHILGTDISAEAIRQARKLSLAHSHVDYSQEDILEQSGSAREGTFDLIILADTLYYIDPMTNARLNSIARNISSKMTPGGLLLLVNHYFFGVDRASRSTRGIHDVFPQTSICGRVAEYRRAFFLATLFQRSHR
jgi:SAM-dependent methyltransferase